MHDTLLCGMLRMTIWANQARVLLPRVALRTQEVRGGPEQRVAGGPAAEALHHLPGRVDVQLVVVRDQLHRREPAGINTYEVLLTPSELPCS